MEQHLFCAVGVFLEAVQQFLGFAAHAGARHSGSERGQEVRRCPCTAPFHIRHPGRQGGVVQTKGAAGLGLGRHRVQIDRAA